MNGQHVVCYIALIIFNFRCTGNAVFRVRYQVVVRCEEINQSGSLFRNKRTLRVLFCCNLINLLCALLNFSQIPGVSRSPNKHKPAPRPFPLAVARAHVLADRPRHDEALHQTLPGRARSPQGLPFFFLFSFCFVALCFAGCVELWLIFFHVFVVGVRGCPAPIRQNEAKVRARCPPRRAPPPGPQILPVRCSPFLFVFWFFILFYF